LTDLKTYSVVTRATSDSGTSSWKSIDKKFIPHTPGVQIWFDQNNLALDEITVLHIVGANASSNIWVQIGSNPRFAIVTDADGYAETNVWLGKSVAAKVTILSGKKSATKFLYSPKLMQLSSMARLNKPAKILLQHVQPGSQIEVISSDGQKVSQIAGAGANSTVNVSFATKGVFTYTVNVDGKYLGTGAIVVS
jgi:hypothetical protein